MTTSRAASNTALVGVRHRPYAGHVAVETLYVQLLFTPPVEGAANQALVAFLADRLAISRRGVRIVTGATSRTKMIEVEGVSTAAVERLAEEGGEGGKR